MLGAVQLVPALLTAQQINALFPARPDSFLTDRAGVVDASSAARINDLAARLRATTGAELAVVTLPTIGDHAPVDVATAIGRSWGVGSLAPIGDARRNAGLVLLLVPRTAGHRGEAFLATGRGIEGIVTDATAGAIVDRMLPQLRAGRYGPALVTGTRWVAALVAQGFGVTDSAFRAPKPAPPPVRRGPPEWAIILGILVILIVFAILARAGRGRGGGGSFRHGGDTIFWGGTGMGGGFRGGFGGGGWRGGRGGFGFGGGGGFSGGGAGRSF